MLGCIECPDSDISSVRKLRSRLSNAGLKTEAFVARAWPSRKPQEAQVYVIWPRGRERVAKEGRRLMDSLKAHTSSHIHLSARTHTGLTQCQSTSSRKADLGFANLEGAVLACLLKRMCLPMSGQEGSPLCCPKKEALGPLYAIMLAGTVRPSAILHCRWGLNPHSIAIALFRSMTALSAALPTCCVGSGRSQLKDANVAP